MEQVVVAPSAESRRRTSVIVTSAIAVALIVVSIVFAASAPWYFVFKLLHVGAAVVWVAGGVFITVIAVLAELARDDVRLLQFGHGADIFAGGLFPSMLFAVLGF